ncbi:fimbrial protein [Halomonas cupida]|uniref:Fimbrial assembly protein (PilN) n=1 Tax=Halomonas cupida TaxID=44933 RepID=A0A1M7MAW1_9GAMM|nr:PilN domain-containing protein [Halomonas cupida]GEN25745.1 fimbrial protein [Halomonas cupida]SHM87858.1 Fimbrial assembly protein (PilN) [Halomonas cupida]
MTINLMPWREADGRRRTRLFWMQLLSAAGLAVLLALVESLLLDERVSIQRQRQAHIEAVLDELTPQLPEVRRLQQLVAARQARLEQWKRDRRNRYLMAALFNELAATVAPGVVYRAVEVHGERLELRGVSADSGALDLQIRRIEQSPILSGAELVDVVESRGRQYFSLRLSFPDGGDDALES